MKNGLKWLINNFKIENVTATSDYYTGWQNKVTNVEEALAEYAEMVPFLTSDTSVTITGELCGKKCSLILMGDDTEPFDLDVASLLEIVASILTKSDDSGLKKHEGLGNKTIKEYLEASEDENNNITLWRDGTVEEFDDSESLDIFDTLDGLDGFDDFE